MITVYINNENDEENHDDDNDKDQDDLAEGEAHLFLWLLRTMMIFFSFLLTEANLIRTVRDHPVLYLLCIQFLLL